jgi:peptidoglycan lytic transglycosylase
MRHNHALTIVFSILLMVTANSVASAANDSSPTPAVYFPSRTAKPAVYEVLASWYGPAFAGRPTTSGERFNPRRLTAASLTVPLGSVVKVKNPSNRRSVNVRINDCGPYVAGRDMDLSLRAAQTIGIVRQGVARLTVTPITIPSHADGIRCMR